MKTQVYEIVKAWALFLLLLLIALGIFHILAVLSSLFFG